MSKENRREILPYGLHWKIYDDFHDILSWQLKRWNEALGHSRQQVRASRSLNLPEEAEARGVTRTWNGRTPDQKVVNKKTISGTERAEIKKEHAPVFL